MNSVHNGMTQSKFILCRVCAFCSASENVQLCSLRSCIWMWNWTSLSRVAFWGLWVLRKIFRP